MLKLLPTIKAIGLISFLISCTLALTGQFEALIAWWVMIFCLSPSLIMVQSSQSTSMRTIIWLAFITQSVTTLMVYLQPDSYIYQNHRPLNFEGMESIRAFYKLGLYLTILVLISSKLERFIKIPEINSSNNFSKNAEIKIKQQKSTILKISKNNLKYASYILIVIIIMLPVNIWMNKEGIGITGVLPPKLPFKLSGILTYIAKLVIPILIAFIYSKTKRTSFLLVIALGIYSIVLGLSTASRSAALMVLASPLFFSIIDRKRGILITSILFLTTSLALTSFSRNYIYIINNNIVSANNMGIIGVLSDTISSVSFNHFITILPQIVGRFESFSQLWLASFVDPNKFGGVWKIFLHFIDNNFSELNHDAIHSEVLGYRNVPSSFYLVSTTVFTVPIWAGNVSWIFYFIFSTFISFFVLVLEKSIRKIANKYAIDKSFISPLIGLFVLMYCISPGWLIMNILWIVLVIISAFPKIRQIRLMSQFIGLSNSNIVLEQRKH